MVDNVSQVMLKYNNSLLLKLSRVQNLHLSRNHCYS
jgi:hypothetical protein